MDNDVLYSVAGVLMTVIVVPWCVFVTINIFALKQQIAIMKMEMGLLKEIKELLKLGVAR